MGGSDMDDIIVTKKMNMFIFLLVSFFLLTACGEKTEKEFKPEYSKKSSAIEVKEYLIGVHPLHNPKRLHEIFGPVANYLSEQIPGVRFKIEASRNYATYDKKLYAGKFQFALPNPFQTVNSLKHGYSVFAKMSDDNNFRGIFLVRKDSGITKVADLKGKAVSFPAPTALAATMMPQYYLQTRGLNVMKDIEIKYVGSQESSIMNVMLGNTVAGATWPPPWHALAKDRPKLSKELKVIWETKPLINNGLVVRDDVDKNLLKKVKALLITLHEHKQGKKWLGKMELSRFKSATNATYDPVLEFLEKFDKTVRPIK